MNNWTKAAACVGEDPELFHAGERNPGAVEQARLICNRCPVRTACLIAAYREDDRHGLRAGLTPRQRRAHLRKTGGNVPQAVALALQSTGVVLRQIYRHHAKPADGGHVLWTDHRHVINVRGVPYTPTRIAWIAHHGAEPIGSVQRACALDMCVAKACLTDWRMRHQAATRKKAVA
ncbi:WhiB family transcriptional regulator [Streptomyces chartreusis]|jgi:WhiB family redox-sensing transcriptional regulator|uniref:WhiB family transcriptional regulator n=1 Tax=Streptomyces chartreusis TaxID=1969 RepID=UPI003812D046